MSTEVAIRDAGAFAQALGDVRSDSSPVNWALVSHWEGNPNEIYVVGSGSGGVSEMVEQLDSSACMYGFLRFNEQIDMSTSVKFVFVSFQGQDVPFVKRGKYGVVSGAVEKAFSDNKANWHMSMSESTAEEITEEAIMQKLTEQSGTKNKVLEVDEGKSRPERGFTSSATKGAGSKSSGYTGQGVQKVATSGGAVACDQDVLDAIQAVRSDTDEKEWCVASYEENNPKKPIVLLGAGTAHDEFQALFLDTAVTYALYRVNDLVDNIPTVKFAFINWVGEGCKPMFKAKVSTHKGAVEENFGPVHCKVLATTKSEISQRVIFDKVQSTSGSKSRVK